MSGPAVAKTETLVVATANRLKASNERLLKVMMEMDAHLDRLASTAGKRKPDPEAPRPEPTCDFSRLVDEVRDSEVLSEFGGSILERLSAL